MKHAAVALAAGLAFGVATVALNHAGPRWLSAFVGSGLGWALFAVAAGFVLGVWHRQAVGWMGAAGLTTLALLGAVFAYYVADSVPADGPLRVVDTGELALWSGAAVLVGTPLGTAGRAAARPFARRAPTTPRRDVS